MSKTLVGEEISAVRSELGRVDAKCGTLAGLAGAAAAFTAAQAGHGPLAARVIAAAAGLTFTSAVLVLLLAVLRPRLGTRGFCLYATMTPAQISALFGSSVFDGQAGTWPASGVVIERRRAEDLLALSQIAHRKYERLRLAVDLMAAGVALLSAALVTVVIV